MANGGFRTKETFRDSPQKTARHLSKVPRTARTSALLRFPIHYRPAFTSYTTTLPFPRVTTSDTVSSNRQSTKARLTVLFHPKPSRKLFFYINMCCDISLRKYHILNHMNRFLSSRHSMQVSQHGIFSMFYCLETSFYLANPPSPPQFRQLGALY